MPNNTPSDHGAAASRRRFQQRAKARKRKAAQRERMRKEGGDEVSLVIPRELVDRLRIPLAVANKPLRKVILEALEQYAQRAPQLDPKFVEAARLHWPKMRLLIRYAGRLRGPSSPPITIGNRTYTYSDLANYLPLFDSLQKEITSRGIKDVSGFLDAITGVRR